MENPYRRPTAKPHIRKVGRYWSIFYKHLRTGKDTWGGSNEKMHVVFTTLADWQKRGVV